MLLVRYLKYVSVQSVFDFTTIVFKIDFALGGIMFIKNKRKSAEGA
jgi:hypothetical protein